MASSVGHHDRSVLALGARQTVERVGALVTVKRAGAAVARVQDVAGVAAFANHVIFTRIDARAAVEWTRCQCTQTAKLNATALHRKPISELRSVTRRMESHSVTCHPTQVNAPRLNPSQIGWYSIYLPWTDGRLSWPRRLVTYQDRLPASRESPIKVPNRPGVE